MKNYKLVAYESRGLDMDFDEHRICELCEDRNANDIHHISGRRGKLYNEPTNLIFLCRNCHENIHKHAVVVLKNIVLMYLI